MCSERMIRLVCVSAVVALLAWSAGTATADVIWSEDFSSHPDLNSGNWYNQITYGGYADSIGLWDTSGGYAASNTSPPGSQGYTASNARYLFSASDKAAFGALYDSGTGRIGGGDVSGTVYIRFDMTSNWGVQGDSYGVLQLGQVAVGTVEQLNAAQGLEVGKVWGHNAYSYMLPAQGTKVDLNSANPEPGKIYEYVDYGSTSTFVVKLAFNAGTTDMATIFLNPTAAPESSQPSELITTVTGYDFSLNGFVIRAGNQGSNYNFDNIKFGTSFSDVVTVPEPTSITLLVMSLLGLLAYAWRKRR